MKSKSGKLNVPKEVLDNHLRMTYSDDLNGIPIPPLRDLPKPPDPTVKFDDSGIKLKEVRDFVHKARAGSAPGLPTCPQETHCLPSAGLEEGYCTTGMVSSRWYLYTKGNAVKRYHKFSPNITPKCRRENIFEVLARSMTTFLMSNHYINTSVQKAGIPGFPGYLEHSQMIWNSILSAKRDKTELHVTWLDLANGYGLVPHHLIRMTLEFFNFYCKVGEIIMKYFNSAFMKFTVKNYTTKWQALEIGIMMGCVISPLLFVLAMELILRGAANTSKGVMKNEHLTLPPSRAFMDDITILGPSPTTKVL